MTVLLLIIMILAQRVHKIGEETSSKKCDKIENASIIDVSSLPDGLYFVKIKDFSNNLIELKKFIKL